MNNLIEVNSGALKDWSEQKIELCANDIFLGLTSKVDYVEEGGIPLVRATDIAEGKLSFKNVRFISEKQHKELTKYRRAEKGDVLVSKSGTLGTCTIVDTEREFSIYESIIVIKANKELLDSSFLLQLLQDQTIQNRMLGTKVGGTVGHLNLKIFRELMIPIPPIDEQQKIASILSTWDKVIGLKGKLIELKKEQKKGLMQKLLTGEIRWNDREKYSEEEIQERLAMISSGEVPEGYRDTMIGILPEEWIATKLKKISKRIQRKNEGKEDKPILTISSLSGFLNQSDRFSKVIAGESLSKYTLIKKNEFAYNKGNSKTYPCGCIFRLEDYEEALVPNVYYSFQIIEGDTEFYKHYFASGELNRHLGKVINTGVRNDGLLNLDASDFFNIPVVCPPKHEQLKIAEVLTNAGKEIDYLEREVAFIKEQKRGLMQLLLTGNVRVKL